jgi:hypothetical protein
MRTAKSAREFTEMMYYNDVISNPNMKEVSDIFDSLVWGAIEKCEDNIEFTINGDFYNAVKNKVKLCDFFNLVKHNGYKIVPIEKWVDTKDTSIVGYRICW